MFTFLQALSLFKSRLFSITGRSTRAEYWWMQLVFYIISFVLQTIIQLLLVFGTSMNDWEYYDEEVLVNIMSFDIFFIALPLGLLFFLLNFSITIRRLHDRDFNGWWILLYFIPFLGSLVIFIISLLPSQPFTNRFGADPTANPPAHFDFYTKQYYKFFGAFGLHPDMPGYPQYPEYQPWQQFYQGQNGPNFYQNQYSQNPYGQNSFGQNPNFNQSGPKQYGQNPYGQNPYGQNQYGQSQYGQNSYQSQSGPAYQNFNANFGQGSQGQWNQNTQGSNHNYGFNPNQPNDFGNAGPFNGQPNSNSYNRDNGYNGSNAYNSSNGYNGFNGYNGPNSQPGTNQTNSNFRSSQGSKGDYAFDANQKKPR